MASFKREKPDYGSVEDLRRQQKPTRGYKEDSKAVEARIIREVRQGASDALKGKRNYANQSDQEAELMDAVRQRVRKYKNK